jgi:hypothetical protein
VSRTGRLFDDETIEHEQQAPPAAIDNATERHRRECEARHAMKLAYLDRRAYYAGVRKQRGEAAMKELIAEVNRQWEMANPL